MLFFVSRANIAEDARENLDSWKGRFRFDSLDLISERRDGVKTVFCFGGFSSLDVGLDGGTGDAAQGGRGFGLVDFASCMYLERASCNDESPS